MKLTVLVLSLFIPAAALSQEIQPEIRLQGETVAVSGISPGGRAVLFSLAREIAPDDVATVVRRQEILVDEDGDGAVAWTLGREIAPRSVWIAVDLATGLHASASPEGTPLRRVGWRGRGLGRGGRADRVEDLRAMAEILLVRPGEGAWSLTVGDGSEADDDGATDGGLAAALDRLQPVGPGEAAPPSRFHPKDVVVLVDPRSLEVTVVTAGGEVEP
jgi:hypothetical protein